MLVSVGAEYADIAPVYPGSVAAPRGGRLKIKQNNKGPVWLVSLLLLFSRWGAYRRVR